MLKNGFARAVATLVGGAAAAHLITALTLPLLTRLYTPEDFSVLAAFASLLGIFSVVASLRFDVALAVPTNDDEAENLLALALGAAALFALALEIVVFVFPAELAALLNKKEVEPYLWLFPPAVFLAGAYSALQSWFVRKKQFGMLARSRITQSIASTSVQVLLGWLAAGSVGLLLGLVINTGAAIMGLGYRLVKEVRQRARVVVSLIEMRRLASVYKNYPKYSTLEALLNSGGLQIPVVLIVAWGAKPEAGYLLLAMSAMQAPMALFGNAIGKVYVSGAANAHRQEQLGSFTGGVIVGLLKTGVGPILFAGIVAPIMFPLIFGGEWGRAGIVVAWLTPWFVMYFVSVPVAMAMHVAGRLRMALMLQAFGLVVRVSGVAFLHFTGLGYLVEGYALTGFVFYAAYFGAVIYAAGVRWEDFRPGIGGAAWSVSFWICTSIVVASIFYLYRM